MGGYRSLGKEATSLSGICLHGFGWTAPPRSLGALAQSVCFSP